eukprot:3552952-Rhodomonas_salina.1
MLLPPRYSTPLCPYAPRSPSPLCSYTIAAMPPLAHLRYALRLRSLVLTAGLVRAGMSSIAMPAISSGVFGFPGQLLYRATRALGGVRY